MTTPPKPTSYPMHNQTVLITGAAGYLGGVLRAGLRGQYRLRLIDRSPLPTPVHQSEEFCQVELEDADALELAMQGVQTVVHLGGILRETAPWSSILTSNVVGSYNVFESARRGGVRRLIYGSSHHVVGFYRRGRKIGTHEPVRPDSRYAASKVFGEALGRLYADKFGLSVICQRIGVARPQPTHRRSLSSWLSENDYVRLTRCCIDADDVHFLTVYAVSSSSSSFYDNSSAASIGFTAQDTPDSFAAEVLARCPDPEPPIDDQFQGGYLCALEFEGDVSRID